MINEPIVFVLGAGASMPYGFPSGSILRHEICTETLMPGDPRHRILMEMGFSFDEVEKCRVAVARSWASSIDMFIASRADHAGVAKSAIALTIAKYERDHELFFADPAGDWFRYLWRHLHKQREAMAQFVSFVTFNYDRSLEHAFVNAIRHAGNLEVVPAAALPTIVHVYGSLGEYPFLELGENARAYAAPSSAANIRRSSDSINVISEKNSVSQFPAQAQRLLEKAKRIVFLGFGYDEDNLRVLRFTRKESCVAAACRVSGTAMQMTDQERKWLVRLCGRDTSQFDLAAKDVDCLMFLRQQVETLA